MDARHKQEFEEHCRRHPTLISQFAWLLDWAVDDIKRYVDERLIKAERHLRQSNTRQTQTLHQENLVTQAQQDALTAQVDTNTDTIGSAITLIGNIKSQLDAAIASQPQDNGAALQALADKLASSDQALAAAVVANTPAAPTGDTGGDAPAVGGKRK
jgi:ATP/maltotriose-dependent transcriptional regulator MalT